jgi:hypothetical protein
VYLLQAKEEKLKIKAFVSEYQMSDELVSIVDFHDLDVYPPNTLLSLLLMMVKVGP